MVTALFYRAGLRLLFPRDLMLVTGASQNWKKLLNYAPRQYLQVRWYAPAIRWLALLGLPLPVLGWSAAFVAAASGLAFGWVALGVGYAAAFAKAFLRRSLVRRVAGEEALLRWRCVLWLTALLPWALALLHWLLAYKGLFGRDVVWAGTRYRVDGPRDVKVLERRPDVPA
jgi:hypothetical protein